MEIKEIEIDKIKPDKNQPRKSFDSESLKLLAGNILSNGLITPIDIDENNIIIDGERRWKAFKIAGIKKIPCRIVIMKQDKITRLKRQLISDIQNEEVPTEERYEAIVRLWKMEKENIGPIFQDKKFCKDLGLSPGVLQSAMDYCKFSEQEPELAKTVAPHIIAETKSLPKEERKKVLKEFEGTKNKKRDLIRELVKEKRDKIQMQKTMDDINKAEKYEIKVKRTEEAFEKLKDDINHTLKEVQKTMVIIQGVRRIKKFYFFKPKEKENFFKFLDGTIDKFESYLKQIKELKSNIEIEVVRE